MSGMHALYIHYCRCMFNVSMASEQKQRALAKQTTQENLEADVAPFAFPAANKGEQDELREAACLCSLSLIAKVANRLLEHMRYII